MNRTMLIITGCFTSLALIAVAHLFEPEPVLIPVRTPAETSAAVTAEPPTIDEVVSVLSPGVEEGDLDSRLAALGELIEEVESPAFARTPFSLESAERLVMALEGIMLWPPEEGVPSVILDAVRVITARGQGDAAQTFTSRVLAEGDEALRTAVLKGIGRKGGIGGTQVYEQVLELHEQDLLPIKELPQALRRLGGRKAFNHIESLMHSSTDPAVIAHSAVALQDYHRPEVMSSILARLDETKMIDSNGLMPWIGLKAFSAFMENAVGDDLDRGLRIIKTRPSLIRGSIAAVERGLEDVDPALRRHAASSIKRAVQKRYLKPVIGEGLLASRLETETEPVLRAELSGGIQLAREFQKSEEESVPVTY